MQDETSCAMELGPDERDAEIDGTIMGFLLIDRPGLWAVDEIAREMGDQVMAEDGVNRLVRAGLIHRLDRFVFATRTAARANALSN